MLQWPWKRFEAMYEAHLRRKAVEGAQELRNALIAGMWSNSNYDDEKGSRQKMLEEVERSYYSSLSMIYTDEEIIKAKEDEFKNNPFFAAMKVPDFPPEEQEPQETVPDRTTTTDEELEVDQA